MSKGCGTITSFHTGVSILQIPTSFGLESLPKWQKVGNGFDSKLFEGSLTFVRECNLQKIHSGLGLNCICGHGWKSLNRAILQLWTLPNAAAIVTNPEKDYSAHSDVSLIVQKIMKRPLPDHKQAYCDQLRSKAIINKRNEDSFGA